MELRSSVKLWAVTEMGFPRAQLSSSCKEQLLHWKAQGFQELAPRSDSFHWKAILLSFVDWVFPLHKRIILLWHSVLCWVSFPEETAYYTSWITCCDDECLLQKACWQMNMLFLFGENQQKAVCYLGWYLAYLYIKPKCVYINNHVLCQYMAWNFKMSWMR